MISALTSKNTSSLNPLFYPPFAKMTVLSISFTAYARALISSDRTALHRSYGDVPSLSLSHCYGDGNVGFGAIPTCRICLHDERHHKNPLTSSIVVQALFCISLIIFHGVRQNQIENSYGLPRIQRRPGSAPWFSSVERSPARFISTDLSSVES